MAANDTRVFLTSTCNSFRDNCVRRSMYKCARLSFTAASTWNRCYPQMVVNKASHDPPVRGNSNQVILQELIQVDRHVDTSMASRQRLAVASLVI